MPGKYITGDNHLLPPTHYAAKDVLTIITMTGGNKYLVGFPRRPVCCPGRRTGACMDDIDLLSLDNSYQLRYYLEDGEYILTVYRNLIMDPPAGFKVTN